jgi:hypothetical protein
LACDLLEPIRPRVDAFVLDWLRRAPLQRKWFFEERDGNCRLTSEFAHELSGTSRIWRQALAPFAEWIAHTLWTTIRLASSKKAPATRLTQSRKRVARGIPTSTSATADPVCSISDLHLPKQVALNARDHIARSRRTATQHRQAVAIRAWKPSDTPEWLDDNFYRGQVQPRLAGVTVPTIMSELAVSQSYATNIRNARCIPHPRHWLNLARMVGVAKTALST